MAWNLFAKKIVDEDMCFMRDIVSVAGAISDITGVQPMKEVVQTFLINNGLWDKFTEFERIQSKFYNQRLLSIGQKTEICQC